MGLLQAQQAGWRWTWAPWEAAPARVFMLRAAGVLLVVADVPLMLAAGWALLFFGRTTVAALAFLLSAQLLLLTSAELLIAMVGDCRRWRSSWTAGPRGKELASVSQTVDVASWTTSPLHSES